MSTINFRIKELVDHFSKGNNSEFGNKIGVNEANIRNYIAGTEPKFNVLEKIANNFEINYEWLLTGNGEMLKSEGATEVIKTPPVEIIAPIKVEGRSLMPKVIVLKDEDVEEERIPLVPVMAQAGYLQGYDDPQYIKELPMYNLPGMRNGTFRIFQVEGLSMYPTLQSGSYVVGQFVEDWEHISDNRIYVVVSTEGVIVKRVLNRIEKYGSLYCKSDNRVFPHINVKLKDVKEIWECKMHLSFDFLDPVPEYQKIADLEADVQFLKQRVEQLEEEKTQVL
ncbi:S24 family peptidase [Capnocytophaga leadbetteri]|uniref:S24 family peptidase n=1 Tax=Capnocytophaga leadbetteri TaxID=327575 RepID=UPI0028E60466|nr:S24 family peptidase [Capnocytophaga leadbetteri]